MLKDLLVNDFEKAMDLYLSPYFQLRDFMGQDTYTKQACTSMRIMCMLNMCQLFTNICNDNLSWKIIPLPFKPVVKRHIENCRDGLRVCISVDGTDMDSLVNEINERVGSSLSHIVDDYIIVALAPVEGDS